MLLQVNTRQIVSTSQSGVTIITRPESVSARFSEQHGREMRMVRRANGDEADVTNPNEGRGETEGAPGYAVLR